MNFLHCMSSLDKYVNGVNFLIVVVALVFPLITPLSLTVLSHVGTIRLPKDVHVLILKDLHVKSPKKG